MYLAQIRFGPLPKGVRRAEMEFEVDFYLDHLAAGWQIGRLRLFNWVEGELVAHVEVARPDSLLERFHSQWALERLAKVRNLLGRDPQSVLLETAVPKRFPRIESAPFLVFYTGLGLRFGVPPIRRGTDGYAFPPYLIRLDETSRYNINCWVDEYCDHEGVWLGSGRLELPAWREMVKPDSYLSQDGRQLCEAIEAGSGIPTYYFLDRYWAMPTGERDRRCPACGGRWRLARPYVHKSGESDWEVAYLCKKCRLASRTGDSEGTVREASIGYRA